MKFVPNTTIAIALAGLLVAASLMSNEAFARGKGRRPHGPPPEAFEACDGKSAGDSAEFESPRGDTVAGTCVQDGDRLVLRPDDPQRGKGRRAINADR